MFASFTFVRPTVHWLPGPVHSDHDGGFWLQTAWTWPAWIVLAGLRNVSPHIHCSQKHFELIDMLILMSEESVPKMELI